MGHLKYQALAGALALAAALPAQGVDLTVASGATLTVASGTTVDVTGLGSFTTAPGATLTLQGTIDVQESARLAGDLVVAVDGPLAGVDFGRLLVGDELDVADGQVTVTFASGYTPAAADIFTLMTYGSLVGPFGTEGLPPPDWGLAYDGGTIRLLRLSALPLAWLEIGATAGVAGVTVAWATAEERGVDRFTVERSRDAVAWSYVGETPAVGDGAGPFEYDLLDADPGGAGTVYYRVEQVDRDGASEYSDVVSTELHDAGEALVAFPSPVAAGAVLQVRGVNALASPEAFRVIDAAGRVVLEGRAEDLAAGMLALPVLPKGYYTLEVEYRSMAPGRVGFIVR